MNEIEKAKLVVKMDELNKLHKSLCAELKAKQEFNSAAWAEYGSELCGGEMAGQEKAIQEKIDACRAEFDLLKRTVEGQLDVSDAAADKLKRTVDGYAELVVQYGAERDRLQAELAVVERVRGYLK